MEVHESLRELVTQHGRSLLADAVGFRGVLDDVLTEEQASIGDINLLVDAVRFDVLAPLERMIAGGADAERAVEEAGQRLSRERGGGDAVSSGWASAVLGYAVGKVPVAVVQRYRSQQSPLAQLPPPGAPTASPVAPVVSPVAAPVPGHYQAAAPPASPAPWATTAPSGGTPYGTGHAPKKSRTGWWVAAAMVGVLAIGGAIVGVVIANGNGEKPTGPKVSGAPDNPLTAEAIADRYSALGTAILSEVQADSCDSGAPDKGQTETISCDLNAGRLELITFEDADALDAARETRIDRRVGTLSAVEDDTAIYQFDPERSGSEDPAVVYWDVKDALQAAIITAKGTADVETLIKAHGATSPTVSFPTGITNDVLDRFVDLNIEASGCRRDRTYFADETEELICESGEDGIALSVGRYASQDGIDKDRDYYKAQFDKASKQGYGGNWNFEEGVDEGAYYAYVTGDGSAAALYWDWNEPGCYCWGLAWSTSGDVAALEKWWPGKE